MLAAVFLLLLFNCDAQIYTKDRIKFINTVLSDTDSGDGLYLALKIKSSKSDTIKILVIQNQYLFQYYNNKYSWSGGKYVREMTKYLLHDKTLISSDENFFHIRLLAPTHDCTYNVSADSLAYLFNHRQNDSRKEDCLISKLFEKNILVGQAENRILIVKPIDSP